MRSGGRRELMLTGSEPFVKTRMRVIFNLRTDPFERAPLTSNTDWDWLVERSYLRDYSTKIIKDFVTTCKEHATAAGEFHD